MKLDIDQLARRIEIAEAKAASAKELSEQASRRALSAEARCTRAERRFRVSAALASLLGIAVLWGSPGTHAVAQGYGATLQQILSRLTSLEQKTQFISVSGTDMNITGANVYVKNGLGGTAATNGLGNLIVGYNASRSGEPDVRTGSHNLIVGGEHNYSSYGGLVVGIHNNIAGPYCSVPGGEGNQATGVRSVVTGGRNNMAVGSYATVVAGEHNQADALGSSILGGYGNLTLSLDSVVAGGMNNVSAGLASAILGGENNRTDNNRSTVSGGAFNQAAGDDSSISGGQGILASGTAQWAAGGNYGFAPAGSGIFHAP
ncbi:MAG TPA: hypothetical protein VGN26_18310 [Armatimonadota bacterium]|jgi:hypothetical protein